MVMCSLLISYCLMRKLLLSVLPCRAGTWGIETLVLHREAQFPQAATCLVVQRQCPFAEWHLNFVLELLAG